MELANTQVKHVSLGIGTVLSNDDSYIEIQFVTKTCKFVFPDSFENFLTASEESIQKEILELIKKKREVAYS